MRGERLTGQLRGKRLVNYSRWEVPRPGSGERTPGRGNEEVRGARWKRSSRRSLSEMNRQLEDRVSAAEERTRAAEFELSEQKRLFSESTAFLLRKCEQRTRTILNTTGDLTHLLDEELRILDLNDAMAAALGAPRSEIVSPVRNSPRHPIRPRSGISAPRGFPPVLHSKLNVGRSSRCAIVGCAVNCQMCRTPSGACPSTGPAGPSGCSDPVYWYRSFAVADDRVYDAPVVRRNRPGQIPIHVY
jgi:hypothetical protein